MCTCQVSAYHTKGLLLSPAAESFYTLTQMPFAGLKVENLSCPLCLLPPGLRLLASRSGTRNIDEVPLMTTFYSVSLGTGPRGSVGGAVTFMQGPAHGVSGGRFENCITVPVSRLWWHHRNRACAESWSRHPLKRGSPSCHTFSL